MMYDTILLRYGELFLKGRNRVVFERKLVENLRKLIEKSGLARPAVIKSQGRLLMPYFPEHKALRRVFGLVSYSPAVRTEKNAEEIKRKAFELLRGRKGTFRVMTRRSDKTFPITSPEFNRMVGQYIEQETNLEFSLDSPEFLLEIEINQEGAYLFFETIPCGGGLPTGVEGKVLLLIENEASLLAGLLFMKRGCNIVPVAFAEKDISLLQAFSPAELKLHLIKDFSELEQLAAKKEISILVTGQVLGEEVKWKTSLTIMKPLVAYSKGQIQEQLNKYKEFIPNA